jgi:phosphoribosylformylglycinamidine synthase subunit PurQ / glutaminase
MKKATVIVFPGSNCDREASEILKKVGFDVSLTWHTENLPDDLSLCFLPGGFSYGDYLRSGAIASQSKVIKQIKSFAESGGITIGICNGFQILTESKILPGALLPNDCSHFVCKTAEIVNTSKNKIFNAPLKETLNVQVAHADGRYFASPEVIKQLELEDRIAFKYKENFNGSVESIAGIIGGERKNILGMMPHPERTLISSDFIPMFENFIQSLKNEN